MYDLQTKQNCRATSSIAGGFIIMLYCGAQYITGNISPYIKSYLNHVNEGDTVACSKEAAYLLLPGIIVTTTLMFPIGSFLSKFFDPRLIIGCSALIGVSLTLLSSYMTTYFLFFLCYSVGFGLFNGLCYGIPIYNSWKHFPDKKGLVTGIVLCGFGFGSFIFGLIAIWLVNPDHTETDPATKEYPWEVAQNVPFMLQILSLLWAILSLVAVAMVFPTPMVHSSKYFEIDREKQQATKNQEPAEVMIANPAAAQFSMITSIQPSMRNSVSTTGQSMDLKEIKSAIGGGHGLGNYSAFGDQPTLSEGSSNSSDGEVQAKDGQRINSSELSEISRDFKIQRTSSKVVECLLSKQFLCLYIMSSCSIFIGFFFAGTYKEYTKAILNDEGFITIAGAISGIFGGIRFQWGPLVELLGYKLVYGVILIVQILLGITFPWFGSQHKGTLLMYLAVIFFCEGAHFTLMPIMISKYFGDQATMVYAFGFSFAGVSSLITSVLVTFIFTGDFDSCYYLGSGLCLISLALLIFVFEDKKFM